MRNDGERKCRSSGAIRVLPPLFLLANIHREWRFLKEKVRGDRMKARYAGRRTLSFKEAASETHFSTAPCPRARRAVSLPDNWLEHYGGNLPRG